MERLAVGLLLAYLSGSVPTAYLVGRAKGVDLATLGSGNYGATNVYRTLGAGPAVVALIVDVLKGFLPVLLLPRWLPVEGMGSLAYGVLIAVAAVLGHVFSIFIGLRGGKGVGTAAGAFMALAPAPTAFAALAFVLVLAWRKIVSLGSLTAALVLLVAVVLMHARTFVSDWPLITMTALLAVFVFWTHRENIKRLVRGEEKPVFRPRQPGTDG